MYSTETHYFNNKVKSKQHHTVGTIPRSNIKIIERGEVDTTNIQIHDHSLSWFGTGTSVKRWWG